MGGGLVLENELFMLFMGHGNHSKACGIKQAHKKTTAETNQVSAGLCLLPGTVIFYLRTTTGDVAFSRKTSGLPLPSAGMTNTLTHLGGS